MSGGVALVAGLCGLSFAAGCVLTAAVLGRERPPVPAPEPVAAPPAPTLNLRLPPDDYATKPIHRNPVMGIPTALPAADPPRPALALVPDPGPEQDPGPDPERPVEQDQVRHMRVVRDVSEPEPDEQPTRRESSS